MENKFKVVYSFGFIRNTKEFTSLKSIEYWFNSFLSPLYLTELEVYDLSSGLMLCSLSSTNLTYKVYFTHKRGLLKIKKNDH